MVKISVVMPTYNVTAAILREAVESILSQTFRDFEFIIIDDCSTDDSVEYLCGLRDERIKLIRNPENIGITKSLNIGFRAAQGKYIARMDSDDIALPTRFEKQYAFMESHPDVIVCGSRVEYFGAISFISNEKIKNMEDYRINALFVNPGPMHPTAFFNHELLLRYHISYDEKLVYAQDYGLWVEICKYGKIYILKDVLLKYRVHSNQISATSMDKQIHFHQMTEKKLLQELLGNVTEEEVDLHYRYGTGYYRDAAINPEMVNWFHRLMNANNRSRIYNKRKFNHYVYSVIIKRTIYQSFLPNMTLFQKAAMFFRYLPFPTAIKAATGMIGRELMRRLQE